MLIWLDGTYGVGKTTVTEAIIKKLGNIIVKVLDSDYYWVQFLNANLLCGGGIIPQSNKKFIEYFKTVIEEQLEQYDTVIVAMALTQGLCKEGLFDALISQGINIKHIILTASKEILKSRIELDDSRDKDLSLTSLDSEIDFLEQHYKDAVRIDTNNKSADTIADEIISCCSL